MKKRRKPHWDMSGPVTYRVFPTVVLDNELTADGPLPLSVSPEPIYEKTYYPPARPLPTSQPRLRSP